MRRQDRLGALKMGVAGQDQVAVPLGGRHQGPLQGQQPRVDPVDGVAHPELGVGRHLVVAAPRRVQLPPDVPEPLDQGGLDVHVDVFALEHERKPPRLDLRPNFRQTPHNLLAFLGSEQTHMGEHLGVRDRAPDVVLEEPTIKGDRFGELFDAAVRFGAEPTAPRLAGHRLSPPCQERGCKRI